jgi:ribose transport system substrate-binding protein
LFGFLDFPRTSSALILPRRSPSNRRGMKPVSICLGVTLLAVVAIGVVGCGSRESGPTRKLRLAFVANTSANFWTLARRGTEDAARELGDVEVLFRMPATGSAAEQQQLLDDLLAGGVDGIAVSPVDAANQTAALNQIAERTLLITHDSDAPASRRRCYIGTDNVAAGRQAGEMLREALPQGGKVMVFVGKKDAQNARERLAGLQEALAGSNIEILDVRTDDADPVRAQKNAEDALVTHPDLAGMVGLWAYNGPAILHAVRAAGKIGRVKIVCFDEEADVLRGVAEGAIHGTVVQQPYEFGKQAILRMARYLRGDTNALSPGRIVVPTMKIQQHNVAEFQARLTQWLRK